MRQSSFSRILPLATVCAALAFILGGYAVFYSNQAWARQAPPPRPPQSALSDPLAPPRPAPLRVAHDEAMWPFSFREKNGYAGFSLELWEKVATSMGVEYELIPMPFERIIPALQLGEIDVAIAVIPVTSSRQEVIAFSMPYYRTGLAGLCRDGGEEPANDLQKEADKTQKGKGKTSGDNDKDKFFSGKSIAVQRDSAAEEFAMGNLTESELKPFLFQEEMFFELLARNVDVVFAELHLLEAYLNVTGNPDLSLCGPVYERHNLAIALPKGSEHLKELNRSLQAFRNSAEFEELCRKWFGRAPKLEK